MRTCVLELPSRMPRLTRNQNQRGSFLMRRRWAVSTKSIFVIFLMFCFCLITLLLCLITLCFEICMKINVWIERSLGTLFTCIFTFWTQITTYLAQIIAILAQILTFLAQNITLKFKFYLFWAKNITIWVKIVKILAKIVIIWSKNV